MASKPFLDVKRQTWHCKWKPDPTGPWRKANLGKHPWPFPPSRPPKTPPPAVMTAAAELAEKERRAKLGLARPEAASGLRAYAERYLNVYAVTKSKSAVKQAKRFLGSFLDFCETHGFTEVAQVTRTTCRDYLEHRTTLTAANSLYTERGYITPLFSRAVEEGLIPASPWDRLRMPVKRPEPEATFWTREEVATLVAAFRQRWHRDCILVAVNTGIRIGAVLAMKWSWVDWGRGIITVPASSSKSRKSYTVPLTAAARAALESRKAEAARSPYVFPGASRDRPAAYRTIQGAFHRARARCAIPPGSLHDLRHTFARLFAEVAPLNVVQATLGHASLQMTQRYVSVSGERAKPWVEGFSVGEGTK